MSTKQQYKNSVVLGTEFNSMPSQRPKSIKARLTWPGSFGSRTHSHVSFFSILIHLFIYTSLLPFPLCIAVLPRAIVLVATFMEEAAAAAAAAGASRCKGLSRLKWRRRRRRSAVSRWSPESESESVRLKVRKLQKLIPGGQGLQPDRLFLRTADYILHLKMRVNVLQALSKIYQPS